MRMHPEVALDGIDPGTFQTELEEFREAVADPAHTPEELDRAIRRIVAHAAMLDPGAAGFADAGMSLKAALCAWLEAAPLEAHGNLRGDGH